MNTHWNNDLYRKAHRAVRDEIARSSKSDLYDRQRVFDDLAFEGLTYDQASELISDAEDDFDL